MRRSRRKKKERRRRRKLKKETCKTKKNLKKRIAIYFGSLLRARALIPFPFFLGSRLG